MQDLFSGPQRNRVRILLTCASGVFIALSPLAGSILQRYFGWRGSFLVFIGLATIVLALTCWMLEEQKAPAGDADLLGSYRQLLKDRNFLVSASLSALAFACHFSFVVVSPILFMGQRGLTEFAFALIFLGYGVAYMIGGFIANGLNARISMYRQIGCGFALIGLAGVVLSLVAYSHGLSVFSVLVPFTICTVGTTIVRPAATTHALARHPEHAGAAASLNNTLLFAYGAGASMLVASMQSSLLLTLALAFVASSLAGAGLLAYLNSLDSDLQHTADSPGL